MTAFAYGQQEPSDSGSEVNKIAFLVQQMVSRLETTKLVQVKAVHTNGALAAAGTVDVLPLVNQIDGDGNAQPHVTVYGIPWFRLQGGKNAVICDPQVGDIGYITVSDRDISNVKKHFTQSNPGSFRRFNLADGIYIGGCLNNVTPTQSVAFLATGIKISDMNGNVIEMKNGSIAITGNLTVTGSIIQGFGTGDQVTGQGHTHSGVTTGSGLSGPPVAGT